MTTGATHYAGRRILTAMKAATRYTNCIFGIAQQAAPTGGSVLDFGAGDGVFAAKFADAGVPVQCVEPDPELRAGLAGVAQKTYADLRDIPSQTYDFAFTINVLEHIADPASVCSELWRVLRPDGRLFVFVPAFPILWTSLDDEVGHCRRFTRRSLSRVLSDAGFIVRRIEYFDSLGFLAGLSVRALEKIGMFSYDHRSIAFYDRRIFPISRKADVLFNGIAGKNVFAVAEKDASFRYHAPT